MISKFGSANELVGETKQFKRFFLSGEIRWVGSNERSRITIHDKKNRPQKSAKKNREVQVHI